MNRPVVLNLQHAPEPPGGLIKTQRAPSLSPDFHSLVQGWDLRICIPNRFPGGVDASNLGTTS